MLRLSIDGRPVEVAEGSTLLDAARQLGITVPTLCHDGRLLPAGVCRMCVVSVGPDKRSVAACTERARDGMVVETRSAALTHTRRSTLALLAANYPKEAVRDAPDKPFHRMLREYGMREDLMGTRNPARADDSHPYLHVDMSQCIHCLRCVRICAEVQGQDVWTTFGRGRAVSIRPAAAPSLATSPCVSCGACASTCPTGAIEDKTVHLGGTPERTVRTTCAYCGVGCELDVGEKAGRVVQALPALDSPVNKGHACVKGRYAFGFLTAEDRLRTPLLRKHGVLCEVSYEEAIAYVADHLARVLRQHGPGGAGMLGSARATNEENYVAQKFARIVLGTNNVDCCARVCHAPTAVAMAALFGTGAATNAYDDIEQAQVIMVCGANATENHPVVGARIRMAKRRGAKLIVVDPRRTELAAEADVHLALRPGANVLVFHAMAHVIVRDHLKDAAFVAARTRDFDAYVRCLEPYAPERVASAAGVSADQLERAARLYASHKPGMLLHGLGMTEQAQGTEGVEALGNLALLTGNVGVPGAGVNPLRGQNNVQGAAHMGCEPKKLTGYVGLEAARERFEASWGSALPIEPGLDMPTMLDAAEAGQLSALWVMGYDILHTNPNAAATRRALAGLSLLVVQDLFLTETARDFAHVVFPAASSFEKDGTFMNAERRVSRVRKVVNAPGQSLPDFQPLCDVAKLLGHAEAFAFTSAEEIWNEVRSVWPAGAGMSYARLERHGLQWPCPDETHPGTPRLHTTDFSLGARAPFALVQGRDQGERADADYPFVLITGRRLMQFNAGTMTRRTHNQQLCPTDVLEIHPEDARPLGIEEGAHVRLRSRHGETELCAHLVDTLRRGEVFTTFHDPGTHVNDLTSTVRDPLTHTPEYKVTAVQLTAVRPA
jgi:formate dehydrogenase major subunit